MSKYLTGLITADYLRFRPFPYSARSWDLDLVSTPESRLHLSQPVVPDRRRSHVEGREVLIHARNQITAKKAAFILQAAIDIREGSSFFMQLGGPLEIVKYNRYGTRQRDDSEM